MPESNLVRGAHIRYHDSAQLALRRPEPAAEEMVMLSNMDAPIRASAVSGLAALVDDRPAEVLAVVRAWIAEEAST